MISEGVGRGYSAGGALILDAMAVEFMCAYNPTDPLTNIDQASLTYIQHGRRDCRRSHQCKVSLPYSSGCGLVIPI